MCVCVCVCVCRGKDGEGGGGRGLLKRQNLIGMTKAICQQSLNMLCVEEKVCYIFLKRLKIDTN